MNFNSGGYPSKDALRRGVKVRVQGLQSAAGAQLNGTLGHCLDFNSQTGRWGVRLSDGTSKALKPENLAAVVVDGMKSYEKPNQAPSSQACEQAPDQGSKTDAAVVHEVSARKRGAVDLESATRKRKEGGKRQEAEDFDGALRLYSEALAQVWAPGEPLDPGELMDFVRNIFERKAFCYSARNQWFECLTTLEQGKFCCKRLIHDFAFLLEAVAFGEIGLLENAVRSLNDLSELDSELGAQAKEDLLVARARQNAVENIGDLDLLKEEIAKLKRTLPENDAREWQDTVLYKCQNKSGQEECIANGFLLEEWLKDPPLQFTLRTVHRALLFQVKKKLQNACLKYQLDFASPESLRCGRSAAILNEGHWKELRTKGLVVIDDVFDAATMRRAYQECEVMDKAGLLENDPNDLCNPDSRSIDIMFSHQDAILKTEAPVLREVMTCIRGLAIHCEEKLRLKLRVPQTVMLSCYGPGAYYRRHMDSYEGKDIPRKITILLYMNLHWEQSNGGCLKAWVGGEPVVFSPLAGRLIMFMSQDIPHEVMKSNKDRYCITQWIWDVKKDDSGR